MKNTFTGIKDLDFQKYNDRKKPRPKGQTRWDRLVIWKGKAIRFKAMDRIKDNKGAFDRSPGQVASETYTKRSREYYKTMARL